MTMLGFSPKLPVTEEERAWVDEGFGRLERMLGRSRLMQAKVVLPDAEHFPDPYDKTPAAAKKLFLRACSYMRVDTKDVELEIFPDETEQLREILPYWRDQSARCAGLYVSGKGADEPDRDEKGTVVALRSTQLRDPMALVATIAHELGHVILLGGALMSPKTPDHEPMTDLVTVFLGLGIFTANSAARFEQHQNAQRQGWSMQRLGYLSEEIYGYALAKFAAERREDKAEWVRHLSTNVRAYYKRSQKWLAKNACRVVTADPIG